MLVVLRFFSRGSGLRPGLLQKWQAASTDAQKFEFIQAFLLDPSSLSSISIESHYEELARKESESNWIEVPLEEIRKMYPSEAGQRFIEQNIINKQQGRAHPQDAERASPEMVLYWIFQNNTDTTKQRRDVSQKLVAAGAVPHNKAARAAVSATMVAAAAEFASADPGKRGASAAGKGQGKSKGQGKKGQRTPKAPKASDARALCSMLFSTSIQWCS